MPTQCSADLFGFAPVEGRRVEAGFDGGAITSDAGALLLGATDRVVGLVGRLAGCFVDARRPDLIEHDVATLIGQPCSESRSDTRTSTTMSICAMTRRWRCNKAKRMHVVPLTHRLLSLLQTRWEAAGRPTEGLVLPSVRAGGVMTANVSDRRQ